MRQISSECPTTKNLWASLGRRHAEFGIRILRSIGSGIGVRCQHCIHPIQNPIQRVPLTSGWAFSFGSPKNRVNFTTLA